MHNFTKLKWGDDNKSLVNECGNEESSSIQASEAQLVGLE